MLTVIVVLASSFTVAVSSFAVGVSSTELTVIVTVAVSVSPSASVMVYVNESVPLKSAFGEYTNTPSEVSVTVPLDGPLVKL